MESSRSNGIRVGKLLGKYRIQRKLATGGFATVYEARDTIAGISVALKMPHPGRVTRESISEFRKEVRLNARLDHPNILPIKDADFIEDTFVVVYPLGVGTLADRLRRRLSLDLAQRFTDQMLAAVAFAHTQRVMHCDIKPENFILFANDQLRLADFGIARVAWRTLKGSGSGTVGYLAPEQALGKPSFRSDVFSLGLVLCRLFSGIVPEWPFEWPPPAYDRLREALTTDAISFLRRALEVDHRKRYPDAARMNVAYRRIRARFLRSKKSRAVAKRRAEVTAPTKWRHLRQREFRKRFGRALPLRESCRRCHGPIAEAMFHCPWCGVAKRVDPDKTSMPANCRRCKRGVKTDWRFCAWCYGGAIHAEAVPRFADKRYTARCVNRKCPDGALMPFMRYCPWCRTKVVRPWRIEGARDSCKRCHWGVVGEFWDYCPWCGDALAARRSTR